MRALLIGAGRMGLTHLALFNLLTDFGVRWSIVEPSRVMRLGLQRALKAPILECCTGDFSSLSGTYDFAVICSPTPHHEVNHAFAAARSGKTFVEKPLAVRKPDEGTLCGYVLLHHPLQKMMSRWAAAHSPNRLELSLRSNTVLGPNTGWRGDSNQGGGVINEFGSHLLSLLVDLIGPVRASAISAIESPFSAAAPDRAVIEGESVSGIPFIARLNWSDPTVRKPLYEVIVQANDSRARHDFYEFDTAAGTVSIADLPSEAGSYLRGLEFTAQARYFLEQDRFPQDAALAVEVDRVLASLTC